MGEGASERWTWMSRAHTGREGWGDSGHAASVRFSMDETSCWPDHPENQSVLLGCFPPIAIVLHFLPSSYFPIHHPIEFPMLDPVFHMDRGTSAIISFFPLLAMPGRLTKHPIPVMTL